MLHSDPPGEEHPPAQPGFGADPITSLHGWQSKEPNTPEVALNALQGADLPQRLTALLGYNPFVLATVAGEVSVSRGIDPALATSLAASNGPEVYALVPALPLQQLYQKQLEQQGIKVLWPLMPNAYMIKATPAQVQQLAQDAKTYAITRVPPQLKLHDLLVRELNIAGFARASADDGRVVEAGKVNLALFDMADSKAVAAAVKALGGTVVKQDADINLLTCTGLNAAAALVLAERSDVFFLEQATLPQTQLETSVALCGDHHLIRNNTTWQYGLTVPVGMIDSGCEIDHQAFMGWSPYPVTHYTWWNVSGEGSGTDDNPSRHGTHVAGIFISRWRPQSLDGCAPWSGGQSTSRFYYVRCGKDSESVNSIFNANTAMDHLGNDNNALVINNSWGSEDASGSTSSSVKADWMVWNRNQIYVFAAGNSGPNAGSINSPGAAKNVIAVGNLNNPNLTLENDSSRGPTNDGRIKPDIYAPGRPITSANAANLSGSVNFGGTSMAAPHVSGVLATLLGHYSDHRRRPAMARAYMMAQSDRNAFSVSNRGLLNSYEMHWTTARSQGYWAFYDSDPTGYSYIYWDFTFPSNMARMYVVLNWIEPSVAVGTVNVVNNDVDLWVDREPYVDGPTGDWGSTTVRDNVEQVILNNPASGNYRMKARRYSSSTNYRLGLGIRIEFNTPTPTNTPSNTPSNTPTNTPSNTPTNTFTNTATPTNTPTSTRTPTNTPTNTATPSNTPTVVATRTPTNTIVIPTPIYTGRCDCPRVPGVNDFDGDGLVDGVEAVPPLGAGQTNRYLWDTDGDGLSDGLEAGMGLNPRARDSDGDGAWDSIELNYLGTSPFNGAVPASVVDSDQDGLPVPLDPNDGNRDSDGDRIADGYEMVTCGYGAVLDPALQPPLGDANCQTGVTNLDALIIHSVFLGLTPYSSPQGIVNADVNRDGAGTNLDSLIIQSWFLRLPSAPLLPQPAF